MVVNRITAKPSVWLRTMMEEELGLIVESFDNPWRIGLITAVSYAAAAFLPILPYAGGAPQAAFPWSVGISIAALFALGAGKTRWTRLSLWKSGFEIVCIGIVSALIGYAIGRLTGGL